MLGVGAGVHPVSPTPHEAEPRSVQVLGRQGLRTPVIQKAGEVSVHQREFRPASDITLGGNEIFSLSIWPARPQTQVEQDFSNSFHGKTLSGPGN